MSGSRSVYTCARMLRGVRRNDRHRIKFRTKKLIFGNFLPKHPRDLRDLSLILQFYHFFLKIILGTIIEQIFFLSSYRLHHYIVTCATPNNAARGSKIYLSDTKIAFGVNLTRGTNEHIYR